MKTFSELKIGDKIYTVLTQGNVVRKISNDGYVVHSGDIATISTVYSLCVYKEELCINQYTGRYDKEYRFKIPLSESNSFSYTDKGTIIFVDEKLAKEYIKQRVLEAIKIEERRIPETIKSVEDNIKSIRQRYYHILNGVEHDVFQKGVES